MTEMLSYHLQHLEAAVQLLGGLEGCRVLEIGGSLPDSVTLNRFGARQWLCVDLPDYWHEVDGNSDDGTRPYNGPVQHAVSDRPWSLWGGSVLDLPALFDGYFDVAFSTSAFEHIADVPGALGTVQRALKPEGRFFLAAMAIWPSPFGHHLPPIAWNGIEFNYSNPPFPPWSHLLMERQDMADFLKLNLPGDIAERILYYVYDSPHINRLFVEDYDKALKQNCFSESRLGHVPGEEPPAGIREQLVQRWGERRYNDVGVIMMGRK